MKLYYMPGACSLATHILLREAGVPFELEQVNRDKTTVSGENFLAVNPHGYVPALKLDDGDVLTENVVLHNYVADLAPASGLAPAAGTRERVKQDQMAVFITTEIHKGYSPLFSGIADEAKAVFRTKLASRYEAMEKLLSDGRPYLTGDTFRTVDSYFFTVSNWAKPTGFDLSPYPKVGELMARIAQRPAVQAALVAEGLVKAA
jgi:glutathione S-transferase